MLNPVHSNEIMWKECIKKYKVLLPFSVNSACILHMAHFSYKGLSCSHSKSSIILKIITYTMKYWTVTNYHSTIFLLSFCGYACKHWRTSKLIFIDTMEILTLKNWKSKLILLPLPHKSISYCLQHNHTQIIVINFSPIIKLHNTSMAWYLIYCTHITSQYSCLQHKCLIFKWRFT